MPSNPDEYWILAQKNLSILTKNLSTLTKNLSTLTNFLSTLTPKGEEEAGKNLSILTQKQEKKEQKTFNSDTE